MCLSARPVTADAMHELSSGRPMSPSLLRGCGGAGQCMVLHDLLLTTTSLPVDQLQLHQLPLAQCAQAKVSSRAARSGSGIPIRARAAAPHPVLASWAERATPIRVASQSRDVTDLPPYLHFVLVFLSIV